MWHPAPARPRLVARLALPLLAAGVGCTSVRVRVTPEPDASGLAAVPADSVRVFDDTASVPKPYRLVAQLRVHAGPVLNRRAAVARLRERAGALGANGVVVSRGVGFGLGSSTQDGILAVRVGSP
jgi:hypothetical protein